jgi:predicted NBD/HSP70 family sugar kinase
MITAVDVGATKVLVAQFGPDGTPHGEVRFPTPKDAQEFLVQLHEQLQGFSAISSIVVGVPGVVDENGVVLRCSNLPWQHLALRQLLEAHYGVQVYIENDAKLAGLAEVHNLAPMPRLGLYLTVSTGIGDGIILDGKIHPAFRNSEPGHIHLQFNGEWQQWQQFASGSALNKYFGKQAHEFTRETEWYEVADRLSRGLFTMIPTLQPDVIIFGGGVGRFFEHFDDYLIEKLKPLEPFISIPKMIKAHHPNEAVLYGCYYYATHQLTATA